jgi:arylsulfatase A-like enzyme
MSQKKPNILLIAIDSLLATHMSLYGYHLQTTPHIDAFAEEATVFENNISAHIPTTPAYASMLSGKDCFSTNIVALRHKGSYAPDVKTLPEILKTNGYDTVCVGFGGNPANRGFDRYLEYRGWGSLLDGAIPKADNLNKVFLPELDKLAASDKPFFVMLRHMDPHSPYLPPAPFDRIFYHGDECAPGNKSMEPVMKFKPFCDYFSGWMPPGITDKDYVIAQYDGAIAYMDACIQRIFTALENLGILDDTIVVLNGDHGETLYDHECWFDHHGIYDVTLKVPLLIRYPDKVPAGLRVGGFSQHKNLVPTLLELAEIKTDIQFDGESLMRLVDGDAHSFESGIYITECTWMRKHGWRTPEWKLIVALEPDFHFKPAVELYNLVTDPDELNNIADQHPGVVALLKGEMAAHIAQRSAATGRPNPMENQPHWHGNQKITYFESSQQAYDTLHIGDPETARKLQAAKAEQQAKKEG